VKQTSRTILISQCDKAADNVARQADFGPPV
jgi:hypothetical protein